jgi:hypothetical protein
VTDRTEQTVPAEQIATEHDERVAEAQATEPQTETETPRDVGRARVVERPVPEQPVQERPVDERLTAERPVQPERPVQVDERPATYRSTTAPAPEETEVVESGPRPRASLLATISLILGVASALTVLTGALAGPGVALGLLATFAGIGGVSATSRRHVAGKSDALFGVALGLAAVVIGTLALTGTLTWLSPDANYVTRAHDWLAAQMPWLFPSK